MYLAEKTAGLIKNIDTELISARFKNRDLSGDPDSGSVIAKRFTNAASKTYGTARTAGKGDAVKGKEVVVTIDQKKEIIEEIEKMDTKLLGVEGLIDQRTGRHSRACAVELDKAFWSCAKTAGTKATLTKTTILEKLEELILTVTKTHNSYVDGVPRSMVSVVVTPDIYSAIRDALDKVVNTNVVTPDYQFGKFHGVYVYEGLNLPTGCDMIAMVEGAVAQPVLIHNYSAEKINLSDAVALELFYYYGTAAVMPDLIYYVGE